MTRFRAFILREYRALFENGLRISISSTRFEICKLDPYMIEMELKSWPKQYEITEERFKEEFQKLLIEFPEVREVVNG